MDRQATQEELERLCRVLQGVETDAVEGFLDKMMANTLWLSTLGLAKALYQFFNGRKSLIAHQIERGLLVSMEELDARLLAHAIADRIDKCIKGEGRIAPSALCISCRRYGNAYTSTQIRV